MLTASSGPWEVPQLYIDEGSPWWLSSVYGNIQLGAILRSCESLIQHSSAGRSPRVLLASVCVDQIHQSWTQLCRSSRYSSIIKLRPQSRIEMFADLANTRCQTHAVHRVSSSRLWQVPGASAFHEAVVLAS